MTLLLIIIIQLILFLILFVLMLYFLSMMISDFFGVPFVPTRQRSLKEIFAKVKVKKEDLFFDLGCGDGRLPFFMAQEYGVRAIGVELNPLLNWYAKLKAKVTKNKLVQFRRENIFDTNLKKANIIYLFLFPEVVEKLKEKFLKECATGTLIVSHGFKVKYLEKQKFAELPGKPFTTYYYRI